MVVRIFVAGTPSERLPTQVLEFSIRETTRCAVDVCTIASLERPIPLPRDLRNQPRTPFSFQRFLIPELCEFRGRAIYLDADMQVFADIGGLWDAPMANHDLLTVRGGRQDRKGQFSVVLLDCEKLQWRIEHIVQALDEGRYTYEQLMHEMCIASNIGSTLHEAWNSLESHEPGVTRLLHYTDMPTQPWVSLDNSLAHLWIGCLRRAMAAGFITSVDLSREIAAGHVRPSLMAQVQHEAGSPAEAELRALDRQFVPPYKSIRSGKSNPWLSWRSGLAFYARRGVQRLRQLAR